MSRTQLAFNSGDLAFQEIITSRPNRDSDRPIAPPGFPTTGSLPPLINASAFERSRPGGLVQVGLEEAITALGIDPGRITRKPEVNVSGCQLFS